MGTVARMYRCLFTREIKKVTVECEDAVSGADFSFTCAIPKNKKLVCDENGRILVRVVVGQKGGGRTMYRDPEKIVQAIADIPLSQEAVSEISFVFYDPRKRLLQGAIELVHTRLFTIWPH